MSTAEARLRKMPLEVLHRHEVVTSPSAGLWSLQVGKLTHTQRATLRAACHERPDPSPQGSGRSCVPTVLDARDER